MESIDLIAIALAGAAALIVRFWAKVAALEKRIGNCCSMDELENCCSMDECCQQITLQNPPAAAGAAPRAHRRPSAGPAWPSSGGVGNDNESA